MAHSITPFLITLATTFMAFYSALGNHLPASTISAAPALLPDPISPLPSSQPPALSPDISPLFPSPGAPQLSPSESIIPLIPSSPSPPNPDEMAAPGPGMAFAPSGQLPDSSSLKLSFPVFSSFMVVVFGGLWANAAF
ncbi:hypothetical protein BUALT_Bualt02G0228200 [Buddleja alternifolia]|uniref:Classical arabinogalactan protein 26-like n=1 Tax=Buddleja alternifolia TaxID=168488 RepID=A0AAV6YDA0_9LAMI|nr:hypothetical protein BUALT_Bualt02G0228200 [Buddleja alternifolia]